MKIKINTIPNPNMQKPLNYCGYEVGVYPEFVEYVGPFKSFDGITVFSDECFDNDSLNIIDQISSEIKIGWMHEPRALSSQCNNRYENMKMLLDSGRLDYIMTYDEKLISEDSDKIIFTVDNAIWIEPKHIKIHPKTKMMSMIYSWKNWTPGHKLRHEVAKMVEGIELFGTGANREIKGKEEGLADFRYSIIIENSISDHYFTEKLLDCLATGTVPIYWGCPNIGDYFNKKGIMTFNKINDLEQIFNELQDPDHYQKMMPYIKENFEKVQEYKCYEDWIYKNVYTKIEETTNA